MESTIEPGSGPANCTWAENRWCLGPRPIHAGDLLWLRARRTYGVPEADETQAPELGPGPWNLVRIESRDRGRYLLACLSHDGITWSAGLTSDHELAWEAPVEVRAQKAVHTSARGLFSKGPVELEAGRHEGLGALEAIAHAQGLRVELVDVGHSVEVNAWELLDANAPIWSVVLVCTDGAR